MSIRTSIGVLLGLCVAIAPARSDELRPGLTVYVDEFEPIAQTPKLALEAPIGKQPVYKQTSQSARVVSVAKDVVQVQMLVEARHLEVTGYVRTSNVATTTQQGTGGVGGLGGLGFLGGQRGVHITATGPVYWPDGSVAGRIVRPWENTQASAPDPSLPLACFSVLDVNPGALCVRHKQLVIKEIVNPDGVAENIFAGELGSGGGLGLGNLEPFAPPNIPIGIAWGFANANSGSRQRGSGSGQGRGSASGQGWGRIEPFAPTKTRIGSVSGPTKAAVRQSIQTLLMRNAGRFSYCYETATSGEQMTEAKNDATSAPLTFNVTWDLVAGQAKNITFSKPLPNNLQPCLTSQFKQLPFSAPDVQQLRTTLTFSRPAAKKRSTKSR